MLRAVRRPLPAASAYAGVRVPWRAVVPKLQAALAFLKVAGPVLGVIVVKVLLFGMISAAAAGVSATVAAGHQILFSTALQPLPRVSVAELGMIEVPPNALLIGQALKRAHSATPLAHARSRARAGLALFFGTFGDTVCQAAQSFLPPFIGSPPAAWRLAKSLMLCGALIAAFNGVFGSLAVAYGVRLFSGSAAVAEAIGGAAPLFTAQVVLHCCSMGTEGILLAARESAFLCASYVAILAGLKVCAPRSHLVCGSSRQATGPASCSFRRKAGTWTSYSYNVVRRHVDLCRLVSS